MTQESDDTPPVEGVRRSLVIRHVVLSALMWITYALYWRVVLGRGIEGEARFAAILLGLFILLQILLTTGWIAHNVHVSRRHGTRRRAHQPENPEVATEDFLGRRMETYPTDGDLKRVPVIVVRIEGGQKRFEAGMPLESQARENR